MAGTIESHYRDLLNPSKDPDKCFQIDISQLLRDYVAELTKGKRPPNFNSAALLLQGSASIYGKKVEYLYNLANQLYHTLIKQKDTPQTEKKTKDKDSKKADKSMNPNFSTDIKLSKNLSVLARRNAPKSTTKKLPTKRLQSSNIPVLLLTAGHEDKGEIFKDKRGETIGNQGDYALNLCHITDNGWMLLPTINPNYVPSNENVPEYYNDLAELAERMVVNDDSEIPSFTDDNRDDVMQCTPDEGFSSQPCSMPSQPDSGQGTGCSSEHNTPFESSAPPSTDEGIGSTPAEDVDNFNSQEDAGIENIPTDMDTIEPSRKSLRISERQALKQLNGEEDPFLSGPIFEKHLLARRGIQKKSTYVVPRKLRGVKTTCLSISEYCARTFFYNEDKNLRNSLLEFDVDGFQQNSMFMKRMKERIDVLKSNHKLHKKPIEPLEDEISEVDVGEVERNLKDAEADDDTLCVPFEDGDVLIDNDPALRLNISSEGQDAAGPLMDNNTTVEMPDSPDFGQMSYLANEKCAKEVENYMQNTELAKKIHEWENSLKPFLVQMDERESFDINLYGSRILNSFEDDNRKQTMTFKHFCRSKEKWEIHRYFMALLPLANMGNVSLETERQPDGSDEIFVTILSRKMHHTELEDFGHNEGSHP